MATWVQPTCVSQSSSASNSSVIVLNVRVTFCTLPSVAVVSTHATTNRLWMSTPQQQLWSTCIVHLLRDAPAGVAAGRVSDSLRYSPACYPPSGATTGDALGHPGPTVDRLVARESTDLRCRRPVASVGIFMHGDGPQAQRKLLSSPESWPYETYGTPGTIGLFPRER